jgi:hypothetical protein
MAEKGLLGYLMGQGETRPSSLAESKNPAQYLMQLASERPEYAALAEYLQSRNAMPPVSFGYMPDSSAGQFVQQGIFSNSNTPVTGKVNLTDAFLGRRVDPAAAIPTLVHELTHATQKEMIGQNLQKDVIDPQAKQQYLDAYKKLSYDPSKRGIEAFREGSLSKRLNPEWTDKNQGYRASVLELPAWAMGDVANKNPVNSYDPYKPPAHLNATLATERQILLDLATRDAKKNPNKRAR